MNILRNVAVALLVRSVPTFKKVHARKKSENKCEHFFASRTRNGENFTPHCIHILLMDTEWF
jgi:hypothetical protein